MKTEDENKKREFFSTTIVLSSHLDGMNGGCWTKIWKLQVIILLLMGPMIAHCAPTLHVSKECWNENSFFISVFMHSLCSSGSGIEDGSFRPGWRCRMNCRETWTLNLKRGKKYERILFCSGDGEIKNGMNDDLEFDFWMVGNLFKYWIFHILSFRLLDIANLPAPLVYSFLIQKA